MKSKIRINNGIALIQVLLIVSILSVIAIYFTKTAQYQVSLSQLSLDRADAYLDVYSTQSNLFYSFLTEGVKEPSGRGYKNFNLHGSFFDVHDNAKVSIQDLAGKINAHFPNEYQLINLLDYSGVERIEAVKAVSLLLDFQNPDMLANDNDGKFRYGKMSSLNDLEYLEINGKVKDTLYGELTTYGVSYLNPMTASPLLLGALTSSEIASQILMLRNSGQLDKDLFTQITGLIESDDMFFSYSNHLELELISYVGEAKVERKLVVKLNPHAEKNDQPITIYQFIE